MIAVALVAGCASRSTSVSGAFAGGASSSSAALSPSYAPLTGAATPSSAPGAPSPAPSSTAPVAISCTASMSNPTPKRGMPTHVIIQTVSDAQVSVVMAGKSTASYGKAVADAQGRADVMVRPQSAGALPVRVTVTKSGLTASCGTTVRPVALPTATDTPGLPPIQVTTQPLPPTNAGD